MNSLDNCIGDLGKPLRPKILQSVLMVLFCILTGGLFLSPFPVLCGAGSNILLVVLLFIVGSALARSMQPFPIKDWNAFENASQIYELEYNMSRIRRFIIKSGLIEVLAPAVAAFLIFPSVGGFDYINSCESDSMRNFTPGYEIIIGSGQWSWWHAYSALLGYFIGNALGILWLAHVVDLRILKIQAAAMSDKWHRTHDSGHKN